MLKCILHFLPAKSDVNLLCFKYLQSYKYVRSERLRSYSCDTLLNANLTSIYAQDFFLQEFYIHSLGDQLNRMHCGYSKISGLH